MKDFAFLDFKMYQDSKIFYKDIIRIIEKLPKNEFCIQDQIKRASLSVILNIAEGSGKNSKKEFARYLSISLGSIHEIVAILDLLKDLNYISEDIYNKLIQDIISIKNQIGGFYKKLIK